MWPNHVLQRTERRHNQRKSGAAAIPSRSTSLSGRYRRCHSTCGYRAAIPFGVGGDGRGVGWKADGEGRAATRAALDGDGAAPGLDEAAANGEAETVAAAGGGAGFIGAVEAVEDVG
jgi:hypothetical protein